MKEEFYTFAVRKKLYDSLETMQQDTDQWLVYYNHERTHSGYYSYGKIPMQAFRDSKGAARQKDMNNLFGQNATLKLSGEVETGNARKKPVKIIG